jgi:hypothetical protein
MLYRAVFRSQQEMFSPSAIFHTAKSDLTAWGFNATLRYDKKYYRGAGAASSAAGQKRMYGFLPRHVMGARRASDIISKAIDGMREGQNPKHGPAVNKLYSNANALEAALRIAQQEEGGF